MGQRFNRQTHANSKYFLVDTSDTMASYRSQVADTVYALIKLLKERVPDKKQLELFNLDGKSDSRYELKNGTKWADSIRQEKFQVEVKDKGALMVQWYVSLSILLLGHYPTFQDRNNKT